jgi:two-component system NarL family response regulator
MTIRVLIADDHALMREGLAAILETEPDIEVIGEAASGREAIDMARELEPDVILMDVAMPDVNGVEATRQIRERNESIKVLALSSHNDSRFIAAILRAGASGYVLKGNAFQELRKGLMAVQQGKTYLCPGVSEVAAEIIRESGSPSDSVYERLGAREREVLQLLAEGLSSAEIGKRLHISPSTVETHRRNIMRKLDLHNAVELTRYAIRHGLTFVET